MASIKYNSRARNAPETELKTSEDDPYFDVLQRNEYGNDIPQFIAKGTNQVYPALKYLSFVIKHPNFRSSMGYGPQPWPLRSPATGGCYLFFVGKKVGHTFCDILLW